MTAPLKARVAEALAVSVSAPVTAFAQRLASQAGASDMVFYGSNLRTGSLEGVLDFYALTDGPEDGGIWPRVSYHEWPYQGQVLRAKLARMSLATFRRAAAGELFDTTIWARFSQPCALIWRADDTARDAMTQAVCAAIATAARLAVALGPARGRAEDYWRALFRATYAAEFRVEKAGREESILAVNRAHFDGLLPLALEAANIAFTRDGDVRVCLFRVDSPRSIRDHVHQGDLMELNRGAAGRVLLSYDPSITPPSKFPPTPVILSQGEREPDIAAVAGPVFGPGPSLRGALAISGPTIRFSPEVMEKISALVISASYELTRRLGGDTTLIPSVPDAQ